MFLILFAVRPPRNIFSCGTSSKPVIVVVSSIKNPPLSRTKLCNTMQALTISTAKSGCTLIGRCNTRHLLLRMPKTHSTYRRALHNRQLNILFSVVKCVPPKGRNKCLCNQNASSPTKKYGTFGLCVPDRHLSSGSCQVFLSIDCHRLDFLYNEASQSLPQLPMQQRQIGIWSMPLPLEPQSNILYS